jgi:hypothetical protein
MDTTQLLYWIKEREAIRLRRASDAPPPWTDDPILRDYRFCEVRREDDRVTRWIAKHWRGPKASDPDLWFAMAVARFVNWPATMAELDYPVPWDRERFVAVITGRMARGETCFGPAYNISNGGESVPKASHIAGVLSKLWARRKVLQPKPEDTCHTFYGRLREMDGFGSFMAAQVLADTKFVEPLRSARDWWTFAAPGPGSMRGINRVMCRPVKTKWRDDDSWRLALHKLHDAIVPELQRIGIGRLSASDLQSCLCEFDKFERVRLGEGKPKRRFVPTKEPLPLGPIIR